MAMSPPAAARNGQGSNPVRAKCSSWAKWRGRADARRREAEGKVCAAATASHVVAVGPVGTCGPAPLDTGQVGSRQHGTIEVTCRGQCRAHEVGVSQVGSGEDGVGQVGAGRATVPDEIHAGALRVVGGGGVGDDGTQVPTVREPPCPFGCRGRPRSHRGPAPRSRWRRRAATTPGCGGGGIRAAQFSNSPSRRQSCQTRVSVKMLVTPRPGSRSRSSTLPHRDGQTDACGPLGRVRGAGARAGRPSARAAWPRLPPTWPRCGGDGRPRVHPVAPIVGGGRLFVFMEPTSPKVHDLRERCSYALHNGVPDTYGTGGEFSVSGVATPLDDPACCGRSPVRHPRFRSRIAGSCSNWASPRHAATGTGTSSCQTLHAGRRPGHEPCTPTDQLVAASRRRARPRWPLA